jgi:hypothetical protein
MPPLTQAPIVANVRAFLRQQMLGNAVTGWFALWPLSRPAALRLAHAMNPEEPLR